MGALPTSVRVAEVGPRDGFQMETRFIRCRRVRNSTHAAPLTGLPLRASRFLAACPGGPGLTAALRFTKAPTEPTGGVPTKPAWWGAPGEYLARLIAAFSSRWWRAPP